MNSKIISFGRIAALLKRIRRFCVFLFPVLKAKEMCLRWRLVVVTLEASLHLGVKIKKTANSK